MTGPGIFRVILHMEIEPGTGPDFERLWQDIARAISTRSANLGQWLFKEHGVEHSYYVVTDWSDEESFREFELSAPHVRNRERLGRYRRGGWMTTMRIVGQAEASGAQTVPSAG
ncbi:antibiotic biosynthesis monooxygenase [Streptomyces albus subsp. chlorinus]|uniref:antibiotic biosynthesis monooxygenase family protein n=1 Tax=Streptomyces albus TaxID=1888 RepID=UPI00156F072C|nr:antibiotic biosynthesis monooxygenase family protein [Streptomyces albus]NSC21560.1 antibiotic biosynthesis monooxygenase [Streptomyces albus subsp. chlorinus]